MEKQISFTEMEYSQRQRTTKRDEFLRQMDQLIPWEECVAMVAPYYPDGSRGRPPREIEQMLRMILLQTWFGLSDEGVEDAIYDSYAMKTFMGLDFAAGEQAPDATTLCKFRKLLTSNGLQKKFFDMVNELLKRAGKQVRGGTIVDATILEASSSKKNREKRTDPEMHSVKKGSNYHFGMRAHIGADPLYGYVHSLAVSPANASEVKTAPQLIRPDDRVVYGDAAYCKMERYVTDGVKRDYRIIRQRGTFKRHWGNSLAWEEEKKLESRKASVRCKVEYVFHIVKNIFHWRTVRYKGLAKNEAFAYLAFASANLYLLATRG